LPLGKHAHGEREHGTREKPRFEFLDSFTLARACSLPLTVRDTVMPTLARIHLYPFKALDARRVEEAVLLPSGALAGDRRFALVDSAGDYINGKRTPAIHLLRSDFDPSSGTLSLRVEGTAQEHAFDVDGRRGELTDWLSDFFATRVTIVENADGGFPDDLESPGPTVISRGTLDEVATWFAGLTTDSVRDRFRANLEIEGVEPFWEDRLVAEGLGVVRFKIGDAELLGTNSCQRCVVPSRDPRSAESIGQFAKAFARKREATLGAWAPRGRFDHYYRLAVNTRRSGSRACTLRVGDEVSILGVE
jgi:MOSC domain-containing protein